MKSRSSLWFADRLLSIPYAVATLALSYTPIRMCEESNLGFDGCGDSHVGHSVGSVSWSGEVGLTIAGQRPTGWFWEKCFFWIHLDEIVESYQPFAKSAGVPRLHTDSSAIT